MATEMLKRFGVKAWTWAYIGQGVQLDLGTATLDRRCELGTQDGDAFGGRRNLCFLGRANLGDFQTNMVPLKIPTELNRSYQ